MSIVLPPLSAAKWADIKLKLPGHAEPRLVGRGARSKVYEGEWLQRQVAVKIIHSVLDVSSFIRELDVVGSWGRHECIAYTLAVCDDLPRREGDVAILTEYAPHCDLQQYMEMCTSAGQSLSLVHILRIASDISDAMRFCHARGLVHRDLKPSNVLIFEGGGKAKVADLIRAKFVERDDFKGDQLSNHSVVQYSAPECLNEGDGPTDSLVLESADVYSFGVILWEMVSRQRPWANKSAAQVVIALYSKKTLPLPAISPTCTQAVQTLIARCLKDPLQRPSFDQIYNELHGVPNPTLNSDSTSVIGSHNGTTCPHYFCCSLSQQLMNDPVVLADGYSYDRRFIEQWLSTSDVSPVTRETLQTKYMYPNIAIKRAILAWAASQQQQNHVSGMNTGSTSLLPNPQQQQQQQHVQHQLQLHHSLDAPPPGYVGNNIGQVGTFPSQDHFSLSLQQPSHGSFMPSFHPSAEHSVFGSIGSVSSSSGGGPGGALSALHPSGNSFGSQHHNLPHSAFGALQGSTSMSGSLGFGRSRPLNGGLGDDLGKADGGVWGDGDFELPAATASSLLMNLHVPGGGGVSGSGAAGSGVGAWESPLGGGSMLFTPSMSLAVAASAPGVIPGRTAPISSSALGSYSPASTKSDDLDEAAPPLPPRDRSSSGPMRIFSSVAAAAAALTPDEAGKAIKALFNKGSSGGDTTGYCDVRALRRCLAVWSDQQETLNWRDPLDNGLTALHEAARLNQREAVKLLIYTPGVKVNIQDHTGATPLRLAASACLTPIVRLLLECPSIDVNLSSKDGSTPLSSCKSSPKYNEIKRILRKAGAIMPGEHVSRPQPGITQCRAPDSVRQEIVACVSRHDLAGLTALSQKWESTPDVFNEGDPRDRGNTPLLIAASDRGGAGVVAFLLSLPFIEINKANMAGEIALHLCCRHNNMDSLRRLLATQEADVNHQETSQGRTPIMAAIKMGHKDIVKLMCAQPELNLAIVDKKGLNALALASRLPDIKEFLTREMSKVQAAAQASFAVPASSFPGILTVGNGAELADAALAILSGDWRLVGQCLIYAAKGGDVAAVEKIQQEWTGITDAWNYPDPSHNQFTPLHFAVLHDHPKIVKALCTTPAVDVNRVDSENMSPTHVAVQEDRRECLKVLLTHDAVDLRRRDRNTDTPLSMCARHDRRNCAKLILGHHSARRFINGTNPGGLTTLNIACFNGFVEIVKLLLTSPDVDVNKPNKKNSTPLIEAVRKGKLDIVRLLVKHPRIDLEHRCNFGGDALASSTRFPEVKAVLLDAYREKGITPISSSATTTSSTVDTEDSNL